MSVTEQKAKEKWCPFARVTLRTGHSAGNRAMLGDWGDTERDAIPNASHCIGSACMAWRQSTRRVIVNRQTGERRECGDGDTYRSDQEFLAEDPAASGYCGLAGKP